MQALKQVTAVFCIACVCAEILAQMTDRGWARSCIKTTAGLYILVVFWNVLPMLGATARGFTLPQTPAVSVGETDALDEMTRELAAVELEKRLAQECETCTGVAVRLEICLTGTDSGQTAVSARAILPQEYTAAEAAVVRAFLEERLGTSPVLMTESGEAGS